MTTLPEYEPYLLIRSIGSGSMGQVYLAQRKDSGQQVAVKVVRNSDRDSDKENIEIEERGARIQQGINEPHVARVNRSMRIRGDLLIEMEYVAGGDLALAVQSRPFSPERAARIAIELCGMLEALHRLSPPVIHGDLKLRNVLLCRPPATDDHCVKVIDFGIAKQLADRDGTFNAFQTVQYSSPERLTTNIMNVQSDLWSVAVMLYEMVSGAKPFPAPSAEGIRARVLNSRGPDPLPESCPIPLRAIIFKALALRLAERYPMPGDMAADLARFLRNETVLAQVGEETRQSAAPGRGADTVRSTIKIPLPPTGSRPAAPLPKPRIVHLSGRRRYTQSPTVRRLAILCAAFLGTFSFVAWQHRVWRVGDDLRANLDADRVNVQTAWTEYEQLRSRAHVYLLLHGLESTLKRKLMDAGSQPIVDYRNDLPASTEANWNRAAEDFQHVLALDPGNATAKGELLICKGHLARIHARQHRNRRVVYDYGLLQRAVEYFQKAETAMPNSADPYLGLARIYYDDEKDYARGADMLNEAAKRGHPIGRREKLQEADALRARAIRSLQQADEFADMPYRQKQYLESARDDFRSAVSLYDQLADYDPGSTRQIRDTLHRLQGVEGRLQQTVQQTTTTP